MAWTPISKAYVFSTLFGDPVPVGVVNLRDGVFGFAYANSWLDRDEAYPLNPVHLPLTRQAFHSDRLFGVLSDSLPDNWGQRVILATHSQKPSNEIEWLLASRGRGVGSMAYSASRSKMLPDRTPPSLEDLSRVIQAMQDIQASKTITDPELVHLVEYGSSFGGARPKTVVQVDGREWLAKLPRKDDTYDQIGAEAASLAMAHDAGISVPDFRLENIEGTAVLLVERFDRQDGQSSAHYLSGESTLATRKIRMSDFQKGYSYQGLAAMARKFSDQPTEDMHGLFRRMAFNVAIANTDDHLKNHGFVYRQDSGWALSPAFDLLPHPTQTAEHAIGIGEQGRKSNFENVFSRAGAFGLSDAQAHEIVEEVAEVAAQSASYFADYGVPESDTEMLSEICTARVEDLSGGAKASYLTLPSE